MGGEVRFANKKTLFVMLTINNAYAVVSCKMHILTPGNGASWSVVLMTEDTVKDVKVASQY